MKNATELNSIRSNSIYSIIPKSSLLFSSINRLSGEDTMSISLVDLSSDNTFSPIVTAAIKATPAAVLLNRFGPFNIDTEKV